LFIQVHGWGSWPSTSEQDKSQGLKYNFTSITGGQMRSLFSNIKMDQLFKKKENADWGRRLQKCWSGFWELFKRINTPDKLLIRSELEAGWEDDMIEWLIESFVSPTHGMDPDHEDYIPAVLPPSSITP
jgi:hypothetical protein